MEQRTMRISLRVLGETLEVEADHSDSPLQLDQALPFFRHLEDRLIQIAVRQAQAKGAAVSCCKGCAACCRARRAATCSFSSPCTVT